MTFSVAARCAESGQLGIALSSSSIAVGARCPWLLAGVGAVSSQNITLPALGPMTLAHLEAGDLPEAALRKALAEDNFSQYRQLTVIDATGKTAAFSGEKTLGTHHVAEGLDCIAAGNMLASKAVINAMVTAFQQSRGELAGRLVTALRAGLQAGGEAGPVHSAAVKVVDDYSWPVVDLRIDWSESDPVGELEALWLAWEPQMQAYQVRALDPREAPGYGVPGDE
ncbi:fimbrial assembly protein FimA [Erwinia sp. OLTSP20]|uniref:DUF1028 domain-containing protein n=1 Tax=unclassified Erwinia TaxID=2622719 RepID=UPI000C19FB4D|nr:MULTISPECIES: DUF1028 domain-containing protein [unclassified Erwinia]PIJ50421.1 fimbrial assembly protein FimA [Erwinia sp. OAMSP11]PIJ72492.1 fimbrial assembly protein FimA [Erwinia sp. OLSSP12]PIJ81730.1 fimbrial assembly protein FimA [Erwinia sp. OLCASP19]PIJ84323.1 fimbrial assembly protein FimA [Erwinia sp. OLMTSP26]PIJ86187.1 fimbrial assembly protein FimA [Erwinia sp. OLMDSP33]